MQKLGAKELLLDLIEHTGREWEGHYRPEDIRLDEEKIELLLKIKALVADPESGVNTELIRERCPTFTAQYQQVLLRQL